MKKSIILLGGNKLHRGFEDLRTKLGIDKIIVIDWNKNPEYCGDIHYKIDIKDYNMIKRLDINWKDIAFVYTSSDIAVLTQAKLHRDMGYMFPSNEAILNSLVKSKTCDCFRKAGILNKYSIVVNDISQFKFGEADKYIFKPNCSSGSRNITILSGSELTVKNVQESIKYAKDASVDNNCVVEEFVEGIEYTVEMLGDNYGNVGVYGISKKYHTIYNNKNRIATKLHYVPSDDSFSLLEKIANFGKKCYRAVGLKNSFAHLEVIVSNYDKKIIPIEIGARSSGYVATTLLDIINDVSYLQEYIRVLNADNVRDEVIFDGSRSSMYYFYDIKPGISKNCATILDYLPKGIMSYAHDRSNLIKGKYFQVINADHERYGFEILGGMSDVLNIRNIENAEKRFNSVFIGESE